MSPLAVWDSWSPLGQLEQRRIHVSRKWSYRFPRPAMSTQRNTLHIEACGGRGFKFSTKSWPKDHYQMSCSDKDFASSRSWNVSYFVSRHLWHGAVQKTREMYTPIWWHKLIHLQTQNKALPRAQTLENVWSLSPLHCEGPGLRTIIVLPSGGGNHLILLLFPYRDEALEASSSSSLPLFPFHLHSDLS